ncbi:branched-chain amino acid ABC transporter permease [Rhodoferax sp. GW822-FHT02A01]|uniref:branched-chain amino acid ABC transporter permease n=1 Tax=Rhodoferax sp. GW822-FHT02A01 TaxID=3141537 RepID=UPI00315DBF1A
MLQILADGLIIGSVVALGAIGLSMTLSIVRFSNFSHGELLGWGAYLALVASTALNTTSGAWATPIGPFSFGWGLLVALVLACGLTALLALGLDAVLFKRLRKQGSITLVIASFGAALALRNLLLFWQGGIPRYYSENLQIAIAFLPRSTWGGLRATPDQLFVLVLALVTVTGLHLFLQRSTLGRAMRATALNPGLARVTGIDPERVLRATWLMGGVLAAIAGVFAGLTVQMRPTMGVDLLLPLFAAVILGGIGSIWGAVLGGFVVGMAESISITWVGAEYRSAAAFVVLIAILMVRPRGLFGEKY